MMRCKNIVQLSTETAPLCAEEHKMFPRVKSTQGIVPSSPAATQRTRACAFLTLSTIKQHYADNNTELSLPLKEQEASFP